MHRYQIDQVRCLSQSQAGIDIMKRAEVLTIEELLKLSEIDIIPEAVMKLPALVCIYQKINRNGNRYWNNPVNTAGNGIKSHHKCKAKAVIIHGLCFFYRANMPCNVYGQQKACSGQSVSSSLHAVFNDHLHG